MTHVQAACPPGWSIDEEVILPGGGRVRGAAARVYSVLSLSAQTSHSWAIGRLQGPPGEVPLWVLREPWCGGGQGDRRLRELRERGVSIDVRVYEPADGEGSKTTLYSLSSAAAPRRQSTPALAGDRAAVTKSEPLAGLRYTFSSEGAPHDALILHLDQGHAEGACLLTPPAGSEFDYLEHLRRHLADVVDLLAGRELVVLELPALAFDARLPLRRLFAFLGADEVGA